MKKKLTLMFIIAVFFLNCSTDNEKPPKLELPQKSEFLQKIEAATFEINTPIGWKLVVDQGDDTYIGRIKNDDLTIFFDQGHLSFGNLNNVQETSETIYFQRLEINGVPAIIHKENRPDSDTRLSVYLDDGENQNRLYVLDSDNDEFFIKVFKTHKFL